LFSAGNSILDSIEASFADGSVSYDLESLPETTVYDEDGFPVDPSATRLPKVEKKKSDDVAEESGSFTPIDPKPKRRKAAVLEQRKHAPAVTPVKKSVDGRPKNTALGTSKDLEDEPLYSSKVSGPTNETNSRIEVTAKTSVGMRVWVCTIYANKWGPSAKADMDRIGAKINFEHYSRKQCLEFKAQMQAGAE
jgi:hypothetical protein